MKFISLIISLVLLVLLPTGCMKEDNSDCRQDVFFRYKYVLNKDNNDLLSEQVKSIDLYIYSEKGDLVKMVRGISIKEEVKITELLKGKYRAVSWANFSDDTHEIEDYNRIDKNKLTLKTINGTAVGFKDGLFHNLTEFETDGITSSTVEASLIKNTNQVKIIIDENKTVRSRAAEDISVTITGSNASYNFDNSRVRNQPSIIYNSLSTITSANQTTHQFDVMRLFFGDDLKVNISYKGELKASVPLVATLAENSPLINTNEDLDRYDKYELHYALTTNDALILVSITVNDWTVVIHNGGI